MEVDSVVCMDALELLRTLPDNSVDSVVTDPEYGIGYETGRVKHSSAKFGDDVFDASWIPEAYRVLRDDTTLWMCTRWDVMGAWIEALKQAGFSVKQRIVWNKGNWAAGDLRYHGSQVEDILFAVKGEPVLQVSSRPSNLWFIPRMTRAETRRVVNPIANLPDHPTQKPIPLFERMIREGSCVGDLIVDPFMGVGTAAIAARNLGRHFICCDIQPDYVAQAKEQLALDYTTPMFE